MLTSFSKIFPRIANIYPPELRTWLMIANEIGNIFFTE